MSAARRGPTGSDARSALLDAATHLIRAQGLHATTVDRICDTAGVTKGAFFHHFASKEDLAVAAAEHWSATTGALFATAPYHEPQDAADRVFAYLDFRASLIVGAPADYTCLVGTMAQEAFDTSPLVRKACAASIFGHAETLEADLGAALASTKTTSSSNVSAESLARYIQAVLQGAFVLAKAANDSAIALEAIEHLRRYLECLLRGAPSEQDARRARRGTGAKVSRRSQ